MIGLVIMIKRKDTAMGANPSIALAITLLALMPVSGQAQETGNPWNPYQARRAPAAAAPIVRPTPQFVAPTSAATLAPTLAQPAPVARTQPARSQYAPAGLEQQLTAAPRQQAVAPVATGPAVNQAPLPQAYAQPSPVPNPVPGGYGNVPGYIGQGYAPQGYAPQRYTPQGYAQQGYAPQGYAPQGYGYSPYAAGNGYGGYPQGYRGNNYSGNGPSGPVTPFGIPGGSGGFAPFSGNNTNGGVPGFNFSPFGFF